MIIAVAAFSLKKCTHSPAVMSLPRCPETWVAGGSQELGTGLVSEYHGASLYGCHLLPSAVLLGAGPQAL